MMGFELLAALFKPMLAVATFLALAGLVWEANH